METHAKSYLSAKKYVQAALELLAAGCPEGPPEPTFTQEHVRSSEKYSYSAPSNSRTGSGWFGRTHRLDMLYRNEPSCEQCDPIPHLPAISTFWSGLTEGAPHSARRTLRISSSGGWRKRAVALPSIDAIDRLFKIFDAEIREDEIEFVAVAPIQGLSRSHFLFRSPRI